MMPSIPLDVDGRTLTTTQRDWLRAVIEQIDAVDATRDARAVLGQGLACFRAAHSVVRGAWVRRSHMVLGGSPDGAKALILPDETPAA